MSNKTIAYERMRTRDLLLEYATPMQYIIPFQVREEGLQMVYPWKDMSLSSLNNQLFALATQSGFQGTEEEFYESFGSFLQGKEIQYDIFDNFPEIGNPHQLYFDLNEKILYYWNNEYLPVSTTLIADTTITGGGA